MTRLRLACALICAAILAPALHVDAQDIPITFKYTPRPADNFVRVYVPGVFNDWGPNQGGFIAPNAPSQMQYDAEKDLYFYSWSGDVAGSSTKYKLHFHVNPSGQNGVWVSDPANPLTDPSDNNNSVLMVADPMIFQMDRRVNESGQVVGVNAGIFGSEEIVELHYSVNGDSSSGLEHFDPGLRIFAFELAEPAPPNALFELTAIDASGDTVAAAIGTLPVEVEDAPRPEGIVDGINYDPDDATRVTLSLFAPYKRTVTALGDFNDWEELPEYLMKRDSVSADSVWFWIALEDLAPGQEYAFQYLIDGELRVGDPYAEKILDPAHDAFIEPETYPNLKPYPVGKTTQIVSVFQRERPEYVWKVEDFDRPPPQELVIYELLVRDFIEAHDYSTLIDTLDYFERLGINAIQLMPISEFAGNDNWGYEPNFVFAADKYYGPADSLKAFIDACHARGIAVILDVVYNHTAYEAPFSRMYSTSPQGAPGAQPTPENPWLNPVATHPFNVFNDANHESEATKSWLDRVNEYWLTEFRVDGFRFDLSKGFTQTVSGDDVGAWSGYDASRIALLKRMADRIWEVDSTAYVTLEHLSVDSEERELAQHRVDEGRDGMFVWNKMTEPYNEATMGYHEFGKSNFSRVYYGQGGRRWDIPNVISYMESHDEQWMMYKNIRYGACDASPTGGSVCDSASTAYSTRHIPTGLDRQKAAATFFFTIPGPKMVWQFGELGYGFGPDGRDCLRPSNQQGDLGDCPPGTPTRTGRKPIRWDYFEDEARRKLYLTWSELLRLRNDHDVFRSTETVVDMTLGPAVKTVSLSHPDMDVAIIGNFAVLDSAGSPPFTMPGTWFEFFSGDTLTVLDPDTTIDLEAGAFQLYTSRYVEPAQEDLVTVGVENSELPPSQDLAQMSVFPNPSSGRSTLRFELSQGTHTTLALYDSLGRLVRTISDGERTSGEHSESFDLGELPAGVYYVRLTTPLVQQTVPLTWVGRE